MNRVIIVSVAIALSLVASCSVQERINRMNKNNPEQTVSAFRKLYPISEKTRVVRDTTVFVIEGKDSVITVDCDSVARSLDRYALYNKKNSVVRIPIRTVDTFVKEVMVDSVITKIDNSLAELYKAKLAKLQDDYNNVSGRARLFMFIAIAASALVLIRFFFR